MYLLEGKFLVIQLAVPLGIIVTVLVCAFINSLKVVRVKSES